MKFVYASRSGNIEYIIKTLELEAMRILDGSEQMKDDYILFTYNDGKGNVPIIVSNFLENNHEKLKGVITSGNKAFKASFGLAGKEISEKYNVPLLYTVENKGTSEDLINLNNIIKTL